MIIVGIQKFVLDDQQSSYLTMISGNYSEFVTMEPRQPWKPRKDLSSNETGPQDTWIKQEINVLIDTMYILTDQILTELVREAPAQEKRCSNGIRPNSFSTPPLKQTDALWELFSPKICQFFKTAVLTLEMDILTITMVKLCS